MKEIVAGKYVEVVRDRQVVFTLGVGRQRDGPAGIEHG